MQSTIKVCINTCSCILLIFFILANSAHSDTIIVEWSGSVANFNNIQGFNVGQDIFGIFEFNLNNLPSDLDPASNIATFGSPNDVNNDEDFINVKLFLGSTILPQEDFDLDYNSNSISSDNLLFAIQDNPNDIEIFRVSNLTRVDSINFTEQVGLFFSVTSFPSNGEIPSVFNLIDSVNPAQTFYDNFLLGNLVSLEYNYSKSITDETGVTSNTFSQFQASVNCISYNSDESCIPTSILDPTLSQVNVPLPLWSLILMGGFLLIIEYKIIRIPSPKKL